MTLPLLPASYRGVPFATTGTQFGGGRRIALHVYPGRDEPWAEDMGRAPRSFRMRGFLIEGDRVYLGGPVAAQRLLLNAALEKGGSGLLTHPTLGLLQASVRGFSISEELDAARRSFVEIEFVESGKRSFPSLLSSTTGLLTAANLCDVALAADAARAILLASGSIGHAEDLRAAGAGWNDEVEARGSDATALIGLAAQLPGNFGRYAGGSTATGAGGASPYATDTTVAALVVDASAQRAAITAAAARLSAAIATIAGADIAAAATALVAALLAACSNPADAVRLLMSLAAATPTAPGDMGAALGRAVRRAAAVAIARAAAAYQPASHYDAYSLLQAVAGVIDAVALDAADAGDDATYTSLRALRAATIADLRARGAALARIRVYAVASPLPALALSQRLYRAPSRADELVRATNPISPLFMPTSFQALAA